MTALNAQSKSPPAPHRQPNRWMTDMRGYWQAGRVCLTGRPIVFTDWSGSRFWQYADDWIVNNHRRQSIGDSINVVRYLLAVVQPGWVCLDLGAHVGPVTVPMARRALPGGRVISVEADPVNIHRLHANLQLNGLPDDQIYHLAIADHDGEVLLTTFPNYNGWQTIGAGGPHTAGREKTTIRVPARTLAHLMDQLQLPGCDLIKIDIEGAELMALQSLRPRLEQRQIGQVIFEINQLTMNGMGRSVEELWAFWSRLPYQLHLIRPDGTTAPLDHPHWPADRVGDCVAIAR